MTSPQEFERAIKDGRRRGTPTLVAHLWCCEGDVPPRIGLAVSKAVGGSVERHLVARRLRHLVADRLDRLPAGSLLVLRATSRAGSASSKDLSADLDRALDRLVAA